MGGGVAVRAGAGVGGSGVGGGDGGVRDGSGVGGEKEGGRVGGVGLLRCPSVILSLPLAVAEQLHAPVVLRQMLEQRPRLLVRKQRLLAQALPRVLTALAAAAAALGAVGALLLLRRRQSLARPAQPQPDLAHQRVELR